MPGPSPLPPAGVRSATPYLAELESLRGLAILLVYAFHADGFVYTPVGHGTAPVTVPGAFVRAGYTGVDLFFVLSAFLLAQPFLAEAAGGRRVDRWHYFARRALRILPLYYVAVAVGTVLSATRPVEMWRGIPYLAFLNAAPVFFAPSLAPYHSTWWSLATEAQFYLVLPALAWGLRSRPARRVALGVGLVYLALYAAFLARALRPATEQGTLALALSLFGRAPVFFFGIASAWLYRRHGETIRRRLAASAWSRSGGADAIAVVLLAGFGILLRGVLEHGRGGDDFPPTQVWHVVGGFCWAAVLLLLLLAPLRSKPMLSNPVLRTLGVLSYSIYMVHVPFLFFGLNALRRVLPVDLPSRWAPSTCVAVVGLSLGCVALSWVTYRLIERPFLVRKARLEG